jgi:hypothetical protein
MSIIAEIMKGSPVSTDVGPRMRVRRLLNTPHFYISSDAAGADSSSEVLILAEDLALMSNTLADLHSEIYSEAMLGPKPDALGKRVMPAAPVEKPKPKATTIKDLLKK